MNIEEMALLLFLCVCRWWHSVDSEPATIAVNIWWEGVRSVVDNTGALSQRSRPTKPSHVAVVAPAPIAGICTNHSDNHDVLPLCYLGRLCLARQVEQMKKLLMRRAAHHDRELLRDCNCTFDTVRPVAASECPPGSVDKLATAEDTQVDAALHWLLARDGVTECAEFAGSEHSEGRRQEVLAFMRRCPVRLQMSVLPQLARDHPRQWQLIFGWVSADPITAYALTSAWESENEKDSGSAAADTTAVDSTEIARTVDGSNMAMVDFFSCIGSCLTATNTGAPRTEDGSEDDTDDGGWEHSLLRARDAYGRIAMTEVLRVAYGYS